MKIFGTPDHVTVTGNNVTITVRPDPATAVTACTCGHRCTNPANCAGWAHSDHTRTHAPWNQRSRP